MRKNYLLGLLCLLLTSATLSAQPLGWTQVRGIAVTENSGATISNYQLKIYFNTQAEILAGHMQANGEDIRFGTNCAGTTLLNHWIEGPMNDDSTVIWVKIPSLQANATTSISMFFGNPTATTTSAIPGTFIGPHSSTDSVASGAAGGAATSQRGFRFAPTQDVLVQSFGKREPTGTTRYVTLFNFTTQAILRQMQVSGPAAQYSYSPLTSPIWLTTGTQYLLQLYQGAGDGYYFGTSSAIGQHLQYFDMKYCNSCTQNTFPTNTLTNYHYGYPDLWYFTKNTVTPAPTYVVNQQGAFSVVAADQSGCQGDTLTLNAAITGASGATTCVWSSSIGLDDSTACNPVATIGSMSGYYLQVTDSAGCIGGDSVLIFNNTPSLALSYDTTTICAGDSVMVMASGNASSYTWGPGNTLSSMFGAMVYAFPATSTSYQVQATDSASGCSVSDTFMINVSPLALGVILGPLNVCAGDSIQLSAIGADAYHWSPTSTLADSTGAVVTAGPDSTTTYFVTGYDTLNGCSDVSSIEVIVHPLPIVAFELPSPDFCTTDPDFALTFGTPIGGTYTGPFVTNGMFSPSQAGPGPVIITYTYVDPLGCEGSAVDTAFVSVCIGVAGGFDVNLGVYPNPSNGMFTIVMGENPEAAHYQVFNMMGQVVSAGEMGTGKTMLDLGNQPQGLYILSVETGGMRKNFNLEIRR